MSTDLSIKMIARADADKLPAEHPLRAHAKAFDEATDEYHAEPQRCTVQSFMGRWARARRAWSDYSGEPLI